MCGVCSRSYCLQLAAASSDESCWLDAWPLQTRKPPSERRSLQTKAAVRGAAAASSDESRSPVAHRDRCTCRSSCEPTLSPVSRPSSTFGLPVLLARCRHVPGCNAVIFAGGRPPAVMPASAGGALCACCVCSCVGRHAGAIGRRAVIHRTSICRGHQYAVSKCRKILYD